LDHQTPRTQVDVEEAVGSLPVFHVSYGDGDGDGDGYGDGDGDG
jgi:hypothetical protein